MAEMTEEEMYRVAEERKQRRLLQATEAAKRNYRESAPSLLRLIAGYITNNDPVKLRHATMLMEAARRIEQLEEKVTGLEIELEAMTDY